MVRLIVNCPEYRDLHAYALLHTTAYTLVLPRGPNPFSIFVESMEASLNVNAISVYAAAKHAIDGFDKLPKSTRKTFIFTGNILNTSPIPHLIALGAGKTAAAHIIECGARAYAGKGYK